QITNPGEAAERALELFQTRSDRTGQLQTTALTDIRGQLHGLKRLAKESVPDSREVHRTLLALHRCFEEMTVRAQAFMSSLQRNADLQAGQADRFMSGTGHLIEYIERFVSELGVTAEEIARIMDDIEASELEKLFVAAAERDIAETPAATA